MENVLLKLHCRYYYFEKKLTPNGTVIENFMNIFEQTRKYNSGKG